MFVNKPGQIKARIKIAVRDMAKYSVPEKSWQNFQYQGDFPVKRKI